jgi:hypothetical protein
LKLTIVYFLKAHLFQNNKELFRLKFIFLVRLLLKSCKSSNKKNLPPINWYYMINGWIKSFFGKDVEQELIELSILQINNSNSAFLLVKNFLIDTNYFDSFEKNTKRTVFDHFFTLCNRLHLESLRKFLEKMMIFLKKNEMSTEYFLLMLKNILKYFKDFNNDDKEKQNENFNKKKEIIEYFKFICINFVYDLDKEEHVCFRFYFFLFYIYY